MTSTQAAKRLRMSPSTFKWQARRLRIGTITSTGPKGRARRDFSEDDLDKLQELTTPAGLIDITEASRKLHLSKTQIRDYARQLGIKPRPPFQYLYFTADEIELIRLTQQQARDQAQHRNRQRQHEALLGDDDAYDYRNRLRTWTIAPMTVQDPEISSTLEGPQTRTLQWIPMYPDFELAPDDHDTSKWGNQRKVRKLISFEDLQRWHPDFMRDRY